MTMMIRSLSLTDTGFSMTTLYKVRVLNYLLFSEEATMLTNVSQTTYVDSETENRKG